MNLGCVQSHGKVIPVASINGRLVNLQKVAELVSAGFHFPIGVTLIKSLMNPDAAITTVFEVLKSLYATSSARFTIQDAGLRWLPPIPDARQIICVGLNYRSHCAEQDVQPPEQPRFFAKLVSSMNGHLEPVNLWPITTAVDYEGELGVIIGRRTFAVSERHALSHVAGYTIINDVSARDLQESDRQWTRAKGLDGFCPMGPFMTTADEISDPGNLRIRTTVNGEVRQDCLTSDMTFGVASIISSVSQAITLEPGDIIATGTPAGVGRFRTPRTYLGHEDSVSITIGGLGTLTNTFRDLSR